MDNRSTSPTSLQLLVMLVGLLTWGAACTPAPTYTVSGAVSGSWRCVDMASTTHPTTITLSPLEWTLTFTRSQPEFTFPNVSPGEYTLLVTCTALGNSYPAMPLQVSNSDISVELILPFPNLPRRDPTQILEGHTGPVRSVAFGGGSELVSAGLDGQLIRWDLTNGQPKWIWSHEHTDGRLPLLLSPDGSILVSGDDDGQLKLWQTDQGAPLPSLSYTANYLGGLSFAKTGRRLAVWTGNESALVALWDVATGDLLATVDLAAGGEFDWRAGKSIGFSQAGDIMISASSLDRELTVRRWDVMTTAIRDSISWPSSQVPPLTGITHLAISPDEGRIALAAKGIENAGRLVIWHLSSNPPAQIQNHDVPLAAIDFSPDGRLVASTAADNSVVLWDGESGRAQAILASDQSGIIPFAWSADGLALAAGDESGRVMLWSTAELESR